MKATTRNATPAQNKLAVKNHTTNAMIAAGKMNRRTFAMSMMMTIPITSSRRSTRMPDNPVMSKGSWKAKNLTAKTSVLNAI